MSCEVILRLFLSRLNVNHDYTGFVREFDWKDEVGCLRPGEEKGALREMKVSDPRENACAVTQLRWFDAGSFFIALPVRENGDVRGCWKGKVVLVRYVPMKVKARDAE